MINVQNLSFSNLWDFCRQNNVSQWHISKKQVATTLHFDDGFDFFCIFCNSDSYISSELIVFFCFLYGIISPLELSDDFSEIWRGKH